MTIEELPNGFVAYTSPEFRFQEDGLLLAAFARPADDERVCDLGTGCGCIPLLWRAEGCQAAIDGVDIQSEGIELATLSTAQNGWQDRLQFHCEDWNHLSLQAGIYDRVVCNPPYFDPARGRTSPNPARAKARQGDLSWITAAHRLLKEGGRLCFCFRPDRFVEVTKALEQTGWVRERTQTLQQRHTARPWLVLCEARKGVVSATKTEKEEGV